MHKGKFNKLFEYIHEMPDGSGQQGYYYRAIKSWGEGNPVELERFLRENPDSIAEHHKDHAHIERSIQRGYLKINPEWVMQQKNGIKLFSEWAAKDAQQARSWLEKQSGSKKYAAARITSLRMLEGRGHFEERARILDKVSSHTSPQNVTYYRKSLENEWKKQDPEGWDSWQSKHPRQ